MTSPNRPSDRDSEQVLAEALRARAGGTPGVGRAKGSTAMSVTTAGMSARPLAARQPLTLLQVVLAAAIAGVVVGVLIAVLVLT